MLILFVVLEKKKNEHEKWQFNNVQKKKRVTQALQLFVFFFKQCFPLSILSFMTKDMKSPKKSQ